MFVALFSKITSVLRKIDTLAERLLAGLSRFYDALTKRLDRALEKLDALTKTLLRRYYRALDFLEKLFKALQQLLRVIFPILFLYVPPVAGFALAYLMSATRMADAVIIASMSVILLILLLLSFRLKQEAETAESTAGGSAPPIVSELETYGWERKIIGAGIALALLAASAYINLGLFIGIILFCAEVGVLYVLKSLYGNRENQAKPA